MDPDRLNLLIKEGENLAVEFKERYSAKIDEDIVAFSNTKGGSVIIGVRDDGTISGQKLTNVLKATITSLARNCKPSIAVSISEIKGVTVVEVPEGNEKPYCCGTGYFRRLDGSTQKLNPDELRVMFRENDPEPYEDRIARESSLADISTTRVKKFIAEAHLDIGKIKPLDFLKSLTTVKGDKLTNAGVMFFSEDAHNIIPQAQATLIAFKGNTRVHIFDRIDVRDDLLTQFNEAILFLKKHLNVRSEIKGVNRQDIYELPLEVLRESVVNAIIHRDYSITGTQISVDIFDDRVEITNPGGLPKGLTEKTLGTMSLRRNELIADMFFRMDKIEKAGTGIHRIKEAMAASGLRMPSFETNGFFRIILWRSEKERAAPVTGKSTQKLPRNYPETTQKIYALILENPRITRNGLAKKTGMTADGVKYHLNRLRKDGLLRRIGGDKGGRWVITGSDD
jgi:ATP-dependent DNA helicase RecG